MRYDYVTSEIDQLFINAGFVYRTPFTVNHVDYVLYWGNAEIAQSFLRICFQHSRRASFQWYEQECGWLEAWS